MERRESYSHKEEARTVLELPVEALQPNPGQPRKQFGREELEELAESIRQHGVLNPLTVREEGPGRYQLVAGERRLRAAKLAGLRTVPCLALEVDGQGSALLALVENLQRRDLDFLEEARGMARLMEEYGLRQEEVARRLGKSQSAVANKLRLLRLEPEILERLCREGLTERHGRALLRLKDPEARREALEHILRHNLNVAAAERYIDRLAAGAAPRQRRLFVLKDVRVFLNTLSRGLDVMKQGGIPAELKKQETEDALVLTISIPRHRAGREGE